MKHKTWFRLVIKAIGVLLIALVLPSLVTTIVAFTYETVEFRRGAMRPLSVTTPFLARPVLWTFPFVNDVVQLLIGLYLFFGGKWIVNKAIPSNRAYCPDCGYDLSNSTTSRCSECGCALPPADQSNPK